jgi:hypothetical protein
MRLLSYFVCDRLQTPLYVMRIQPSRQGWIKYLLLDFSPFQTESPFGQYIIPIPKRAEPSLTEDLSKLTRSSDSLVSNDQRSMKPFTDSGTKISLTHNKVCSASSQTPEIMSQCLSDGHLKRVSLLVFYISSLNKAESCSSFNNPSILRPSST